MPNSLHRKRTLKKSQDANARNRATRSAMRTAVKHAQEATVAGADDAAARTSYAIKLVDKAADANLIHANKAARMKSQLDRTKTADASA